MKRVCGEFADWHHFMRIIGEACREVLWMSGHGDDPLPWPWRMLQGGEECGALQRRYDFEITSIHPLAGLGGMIVGRSDADDDVLIRLADGRLAIVHLTWSDGGRDWPHFVIYDSIEAAVRDQV